MKTLRLLRNVAVLFILVIGLLASRPGPAVARTASKSCDLKVDYNCSIDSSGKCHESRCERDGICYNLGCVVD